MKEVVMKVRRAIPTELKDILLVECGYRCTVPYCGVTQSLEFHHIDEDPSNNHKNIIIVLCAVHHHQADIKQITKRSLYLMKQILLNIDGTLESAKHRDDIHITLADFMDFVETVSEMPKASLRILSREFLRTLIGLDSGYRSRRGLEYHDFLEKRNLVIVEEKEGPSLFRISEKGKLLCKFLYTSQYNLPNVYFDGTSDSSILKDIYDQKDLEPICFGSYSPKDKKGKCDACNGKGAVKCPKCSGKGEIHPTLIESYQCSNCKGSGIVACGSCKGKGYV
jgi:hypothetical protein